LRDELSIGARKNTEQELIADALNAFQERATAIAKALGRSGHRIVNIISTRSVTCHRNKLCAA
jgi:predicted secreted protein